jgi:hypothetical protein
MQGWQDKVIEPRGKIAAEGVLDKVKTLKREAECKMEIETTNLKELSYDELVKTEKTIERGVECGDIILIKEKDSDIWDTHFVTLVTDMGIYLHLGAAGLDGGGIIFWPDHNMHKLYDNTVFIHIPIKKG